MPPKGRSVEGSETLAMSQNGPVGQGNLFDALPNARAEEQFTELLTQPGARIERIVSQGQSTPDDIPMVQDADEWVILLSGAAALRIEGAEPVALRPGDYQFIPAGQRHWVTWTDPTQPSVWLAVHLDLAVHP